MKKVFVKTVFLSMMALGLVFASCKNKACQVRNKICNVTHDLLQQNGNSDAGKQRTDGEQCLHGDAVHRQSLLDALNHA